MNLARALLITILVVAGCGSPMPSPADVVTLEFDCQQFEVAGAGNASLTAEVAAPVGQQLDVRLCSNPSTGFAWDTPTATGDRTLEALDRGILQEVGGPPGASGLEWFTFRATSAGSTTLRFTYSQPWDGGSKGVWSVDLDVTVE
ncbi:MAG: protease inhibitor I42 family protein [Chloroflexota bacterium]